ncbi:MAG TPA: DNA methyltransferase, partial [Spirochaetota bacterium]|nr:DNA methyltransferase [Spirochaetota bacterium]
MKINTFEKEIINDKAKGLSDQEIGNKYNINLKQIEKIITKEKGINVTKLNKSKKINNLFPKDFKLENNTVWSFKSRGNWATHNGNYRGNWSPYIPRNVILRYSNENDTVLDYFCGSGTTAVECKLLNRNFIGIDINEKAIELARENLDFQFLFSSNIELKVGDARNLDFIKDNSIDLICAHPPYANIINYTYDNKYDLSHLNINEFLTEIKKIADESYRVLKENKYCAILI